MSTHEQAGPVEFGVLSPLRTGAAWPDVIAPTFSTARQAHDYAEDTQQPPGDDYAVMWRPCGGQWAEVNSQRSVHQVLAEQWSHHIAHKFQEGERKELDEQPPANPQGAPGEARISTTTGYHASRSTPNDTHQRHQTAGDQFVAALPPAGQDSASQAH